MHTFLGLRGYGLGLTLTLTPLKPEYRLDLETEGVCLG